jgi:carbon storage regulator
MLVLSRKLNETIIINDIIRLTVVDIRPNQVRLGFEAPKEVAIYREELRGRAQPVNEFGASPASRPNRT